MENKYYFYKSHKYVTLEINSREEGIYLLSNNSFYIRAKMNKDSDEYRRCEWDKKYCSGYMIPQKIGKFFFSGDSVVRKMGKELLNKWIDEKEIFSTQT